MQQQGQEQCCLPATRCDTARKTLDTLCIHTCLGYFFIWLCRYFCSASVLTLQSPCMGNQSPAASSASWARLCSLGPGFPMGWDLEGEGKAIPPTSFGSTLAQLDGAQHPHPMIDYAGCWQGCALLLCLPCCPCSCCAGRACQRGTSVGPFSQ